MTKNVTIHIGLHKTASTFMQRKFFPLYAQETGYTDLRKLMPRFLGNILHCNDLEFDLETAKVIFYQELESTKWSKQRLLFSEEQFCGSPWDNAACRKLYFDRLNGLFPSAKYMIVLRNQNDFVKSLYLQYIKTGGSASWKEFLTHKRHPLSFGLKTYLNYGLYIEYMLSHVGTSRIGCFFYEDMKQNPIDFLKQIASFLGLSPGAELNEIIHCRMNPSIPSPRAKVLSYVNKLCRSERQPFLLLPNVLHSILVYAAVNLSHSGTSGKIIPEHELTMFCKEVKEYNHIIRKVSSRDISQIGY